MAAKQNVNEKSRGFGITKFFRGVKAEIKRITWPPKEEAKKAAKTEAEPIEEVITTEKP